MSTMEQFRAKYKNGEYSSKPGPKEDEYRKKGKPNLADENGKKSIPAGTFDDTEYTGQSEEKIPDGTFHSEPEI